MSAGSFGGLGKGKKPGIGGGKPSAPAVKPRVTTSGGGTAGRPDIRNPLRQKPRITGSGGTKSPLRQGPKVTTSGGKVAGKGLGKFAGKVPIVGPLIDFGIRRLIFKEPLGKAAAGAVGAGAGQALGGILGGSLGGIVGSVVPVAGTLLGAGAGSLVGSVIGGFIGDWIGVSLYDFIEAQKDIKTKKMSSGGKVSSSTTDKKKRKGKLKRRQEILERLRPGKDIGGEKEIEKIYPNPERKFFGITLPSFEGLTNLFFGGKDKKKDGKKYPNAIKTLLDVGDALGTSGDWIGSLMRAGVQVALGQKPDAKSLAKTVSSVLQNVTDPAIKGIKSISRELLGFAAGGEVSSSILSSGDTLSLERSIEANLRNKFDDAIGAVRTQSRKKGEKTTEKPKAAPGEEPPIPGRESMIEENIQRGKEGGATFGEANLSKLQRQALAILSKYESAGSGGYNAVNQIGIAGGRGVSGFSGDFRNMKQHKGRALTDLTIQEILSLQAEKPGMSNQEWIRQGRLHAVGRYQFIGNTLPGVVKRSGVPTNAKFTSEVQDLLGMQYLKERGIGAWVGPSDKATREERAIIERARKEPIRYQPQISKGAQSKPGFNLLKPSTWFGGGPDGKGAPSTGGKKFPLPKGMIGTGEGQVFGAARDYGGHRGVDIVEKPPWGKDPKIPVVAYRDGIVAKSSPHFPYKTSGYTSNLSIDHGGGLKVTYLHMSPGLKPGDKVSSGQQIGRLIDLGDQTHLHFQAYQDNKIINPTGLLKMQGGGLVSPSKPNVSIPNSFASYNDPRKSSTLAVQPVIVEKMMPFPVDSLIAFPSGGSSGVNNSVLPSLMQG
jgi:murein DD-endopeptidase MepM/ murein hydrolase activator NlpD